MTDTATSSAAARRDEELQGHYAGAVTRLAAYAVDTATLTTLYAIGAVVFEYLVSTLISESFDLSDHPWAAAASLTVWTFLYMAVPLAASGRTFGSAVLGLRVMRADGRDLDPVHAVVRVLVFPLSFLVFGLGFALILVQREHRALHDLIAKTCVVYAWDARAARVRVLAREPAPDTPAGGG